MSDLGRLWVQVRKIARRLSQTLEAQKIAGKDLVTGRLWQGCLATVQASDGLAFLDDAYAALGEPAAVTLAEEKIKDAAEARRLIDTARRAVASAALAHLVRHARSNPE